MNHEFERFDRYAKEQDAYEQQMQRKSREREPRQAFTFNENGEPVPIVRATPFAKDEKPTRDRPTKPGQQLVSEPLNQQAKSRR